jgi:energy-coupling factor transport system substrate-specific component
MLSAAIVIKRRNKMAKREVTNSNQQNDRRMKTKDLIYAGAFGAIYLVVMLVIVMGTSGIAIMYLLAPLTVGIVCATIYELCVLKVKKFGPALILGVLFSLVSCMGNIPGMIGCFIAALLAELIIKAGGYSSRKSYLASYPIFNLTMAMPYTMLGFQRETFIRRAADWYSQGYADALDAAAPSWIWYGIAVEAVIGGIIGVLLASKLIKKHFDKAGII